MCYEYVANKKPQSIVVKKDQLRVKAQKPEKVKPTIRVAVPFTRRQEVTNAQS